MAFGDYAIDITELDATIGRYEDLTKHCKPQFTGLTDTARWFDPSKEKMTGKIYYYRSYVHGTSSARWEKAVTAATTEFPIAMDFKWQEMSIPYAQLKFLRKSAKYNLLEQARTSTNMAVEDLVSRIVADTEADFAFQLNSAVHKGGTCRLATLKGIYNINGTAFTGAAGHAPAYINIQGGSIGHFMSGDVLNIYSSADHTTLRATVVVHDVIYGPDGPNAAGIKVADIGPGIICEPCAADGVVSATTTAWNAVATPDADDDIARSGEFTTTASSYRQIHGFPDVFDSTVDMYIDGDGSTALDREAAGYFYLNPYMVYAAADGAEVTFDPDVHLRELENNAPFIANITQGRASRVGMLDDGIKIKNSMVLITTPDIVNDAVAEAKTTQRFTATQAEGLSEAQKRKLFGEVGFTGIVYHSPTIGAIALQADQMCAPYRMYMIEPNSFFYVLHPGMSGNPEWLRPNGQRFMAVPGGTNGTVTYYVQGGAHTALAMWCDQPRANAQIRGVKAGS